MVMAMLKQVFGQKSVRATLSTTYSSYPAGQVTLVSKV